MNIEIPWEDKIISLAVDLWRLEEKIGNIESVSDKEQEKIWVSMKRLRRFVEECKIEVKWYNGQKYAEEVNAYELKWIEETQDTEKNGLIKDTIEPAVFIDGKLIKTGKIIVYKTNS